MISSWKKSETTARQSAGLNVFEPQSGKVVHWYVGAPMLAVNELLVVDMGVLNVEGAEIVNEANMVARTV